MEDKAVIVTRQMVGICGMQVCAKKGTSDSEILAVCNRENPSGTMHGWNEVVRTVCDESMFHGEGAQPVDCEQDSTREHLIVLC